MLGVICLGSQELDWRRVADEAVRILTCVVCTAGSADGRSQPFWVGAAYRPGGVVLVARNPASKPLPEDAGRLLERLRAAPSPAGFAEWSTWRIRHMTATPWTQWQRAFAKAVTGCWQPEQLAWLNVVPAPSVNDAAPNPALCEHGRRVHLTPMLTQVLQPAAVITRYTAAADAVNTIPGPWQDGGVFAINGRVASTSHTSRINQALRDRGFCDAAPAATPAPMTPPRPPRPQPRQRTAARGAGTGLAALRDDLLTALTAASGHPAVTKPSYTSVGDAPVWAFVQQRADAVQVKFRVAPPYRSAKAISARLVEAGVAAHVGEVRSAPGSTRLFAWVRGPGDLAALQAELPALWRDYGLLR